MLSMAFVHAVWRLILAPHVWDKTAHEADLDTEYGPGDSRDSGREAA